MATAIAVSIALIVALLFFLRLFTLADAWERGWRSATRGEPIDRNPYMELSKSLDKK